MIQSKQVFIVIKHSTIVNRFILMNRSSKQILCNESDLPHMSSIYKKQSKFSLLNKILVWTA